MSHSLFDYYRLPESLRGDFAVAMSTGASDFGLDFAVPIAVNRAGVNLSFEFDSVIETLRGERYVADLMTERERVLTHRWMRAAYYLVRGVLPVPIRRHLQRFYFNDWNKRSFPAWPIDTTVDRLHEQLLTFSMGAARKTKVPFIWFWPESARNCLILTHDVETQKGRDLTPHLIEIDKSYGFVSSFQVIPEGRYRVTKDFIKNITDHGCELNVHDLNHDGHLYRTRAEFLRRARKINSYICHYQAQGFRAGAMYRKTDWYDAYDFLYDMSIPNVAHLEPQRGGCCTVFPFFVGNILEIPLTTTQDYAVYNILDRFSIDLWVEQLALIQKANGLMSFLIHADYSLSRRSRRVYESLLDHLCKLVVEQNIWVALPRDVDRWWRERSKMRLVFKQGEWRIEGAGAERACIAYASLDNEQRLTYEVSAAMKPDHQCV